MCISTCHYDASDDHAANILSTALRLTIFIGPRIYCSLTNTAAIPCEGQLTVTLGELITADDSPFHFRYTYS